MVDIRGLVEKAHTRRIFDGATKASEDLGPPSLAEVRDAFDQALARDVRPGYVSSSTIGSRIPRSRATSMARS